jgi:DNA-binding NtrC family response regulator
MNDLLNKGRILVVDDEEKIRTILAAVLKDEGYEVATAADGFEAMEKCKSFDPQLVIADLQMPRMDGIETISRIKEQLPGIVSVILTAHGSIATAVQAIKHGVYDYLTKPYDNEQFLLVVRRAVELHQLSDEVSRLKTELRKRWGIENILGDSPLLQNVRKQIQKIAETDATVLIEGASGTGKELAARAIHYESKRRGYPLVIVDCAAIPSSLLESEFFGHERGAFTDAKERRIGRFEEANAGSIFLDEIGELPLEAQTRLLRVLQEKEFTRVGGSVPVKVDVRVIVATNKDLETQMRDGKFREDLYYRLNVLKLTMPSLRKHKEDIPLYARHFLAKHRDDSGRRVDAISSEALDFLSNHEWKGNVRELESAVQRAMMNMTGNRLERNDFDFLAKQDTSKRSRYDEEKGLEPYIRSLSEEAERQIILDTLCQVTWNRTEAAEKLKISRKTLFNKMQQYGLEGEDQPKN